MDIDKLQVLDKIRKIYLKEIGYFKEHEIDNESDVGKMGGTKVASDDLTCFALGVQNEFKITISQGDWYTVSSLNDITNLVLKNLKKLPL